MRNDTHWLMSKHNGMSTKVMNSIPLLSSCLRLFPPPWILATHQLITKHNGLEEHFKLLINEASYFTPTVTYSILPCQTSKTPPTMAISNNIVSNLNTSNSYHAHTSTANIFRIHTFNDWVSKLSIGWLVREFCCVIQRGEERKKKVVGSRESVHLI